jgi:hypothetical protein
VIALAPDVHRVFFLWQVYVEGLRPGTHYTWRLAQSGADLAHAPDEEQSVSTRDRYLAQPRSVVVLEGG